MKFGEAVSYYLREKNMSAGELSRRTGFSTAYISKLRSGQCADPTFQRAIAIINALDVDMDDFIALQTSDGEEP